MDCVLLKLIRFAYCADMSVVDSSLTKAGPSVSTTALQLLHFCTLAIGGGDGQPTTAISSQEGKEAGCLDLEP